MIKLITCAIIFCLSAISFATGLVLCEDKQTFYEIEVASSATHAELYAAELIRDILEKSSGAHFRFVGESDAREKGVPRIRVGGPLYSEKCGLPLKEYYPEEWLIQTVGRDIIVTGGRPRGVFYAALEFLETFVGYRYYSVDMEVIPEKERIEVTESVKINGKPAFPNRCLYWRSGKAVRRKFQISCQCATGANDCGLLLS